MTDKIENYDDLLKGVTSTKEDLQKLCDDVSNVDKKKVEELQTNLKSYKEALTRLESEISQEQKDLITEEINGIESSLAGIEAGIKLGEEVTQEGVGNTPESDNSSPSKRRSVGERLEDQWKGLEKREDWKNGKNILRVLGGVGIAGGAVSLIKRIFGGNDKEEGEGFSFKKTLKWIAIGACTILGIKGVTKLMERSETDEKRYNGYDEFAKNPANKEAFENYETIGGYVDEVYTSLYDRELKAGYMDELQMSRISIKESNGEKEYKGIVAYCVDRYFGSTQDFMAQNSSFKEGLMSGLRAMVKTLQNISGDALKFVVNQLPSFGRFKDLQVSRNEKLEMWMSQAEKAENEMKYFYRQSIRLQTYLFEKQDQLERKLAKHNAGNHTEDEILSDGKLMEQYVYNNSNYKKFLEGNIGTGAIPVLKKYGIFDTSISDEVPNIVRELDKTRDKIIPQVNGEDLIEVIDRKNQKREPITEDAELEQACDNVQENIDEEIVEEVEKGAWSIYHDLFNIGGANLRAYIDTAGIFDFFTDLKKDIDKAKEKLKNGELDDKGKYELSQIINNLLALKKEAKLGEYTIKVDQDKNGNFIYRIPGFLLGLVSQISGGFGKILGGNVGAGLYDLYAASIGAGATLIISGGILYLLGKDGSTLIKVGAIVGTAPVTLPYLAVKGTIKWSVNHSRTLSRRAKKMGIRYYGDNAGTNIVTNLRRGDITLDEAASIISTKMQGEFVSPATQKSLTKQFGSRFTNGRTVQYSPKEIKKQLIVDTIFGGDDIVKSKLRTSPLLDEIAEYYDHSVDIQKALRKGYPSPDTQEFLDILRDAKKAYRQAIIDSAAKLKNIQDWEKMVDDIIFSRSQIENIVEDAFDQAKSSGAKPRQIRKGLRNAEKQMNKQLNTLDEFTDILRNMNPSEFTRALEFINTMKKAAKGDLIKVADNFRTLIKIIGTKVNYNGKDVKITLEFLLDNLDEVSNILSLPKFKKFGKSIDDLADTLKELCRIKKSVDFSTFKDGFTVLSKTLRKITKIL